MIEKSALIVDDDDDIAEMLSEFLSGEGYAVRKASNGQEALEAMDQSNFDIVLTDLSMPVMDGLDLIMKMRSSLSLKGVPVIVISGALTDSRLRKLSSFRVCHVLEKPFSTEEVMAKIKAVTSKPLQPVGYHPELRSMVRDAATDILSFYVGDGLVFKEPQVNQDYQAPCAVTAMVPLFGRRIYGSIAFGANKPFIEIMSKKLFDSDDKFITAELQAEIVS